MSPQNAFPVVFEELKEILKPYAPKLTVTADTPNAYSLDGPYSEKWRKPLFFGSVQIKKNYVSFLDSVQKELGKKLTNRTFYEDLIANAILFNVTDELFGRKNKNAIGDTNLKSFTVAFTLSYFHEKTDNCLNLKSRLGKLSPG